MIWKNIKSQCLYRLLDKSTKQCQPRIFQIFYFNKKVKLKHIPSSYFITRHMENIYRSWKLFDVIIGFLHSDIIWSDVIQKQTILSLLISSHWLHGSLLRSSSGNILSNPLSSKLFISPTINQLLLLYLIYVLGWFLFKREARGWWYWARILNEHEMRFAFAFINLIFDILRITF